MKFIHIADVHLGASPDAGSAYSQNRTQEIWNSFAGVVEECRIQEIEVLLIAGDLFHRQPLLRELKEVNYLFEQIPNTHIFLIAGNHDYLRSDSYYWKFSWPKHVHMIMEEEIGCVEIPELKLAVYGNSYHSREILKPFYDEVMAQKRQPFEILLAHGGDEKHIPIQKNKIQMSGFAYIALGHIHKPQKLIDKRVYYAGALEPIDKNDIGRHGYLQGELSEAGLKVSFIPYAQRRYIHLVILIGEGTTGYALKRQIMQNIEEQGIENIYKLILTGLRDPETLFHLSDMDVYGNIIEFVDSTRPAFNFKQLAKQNEDNLIGRFIENLQGSEKDSIEYMALCEGVQALMEAGRGQT